MWFRRHHTNESDQEARDALRDATENLHNVRKRWPEVATISAAFREIREHNHFAEKLGAIIARNGGSAT